MPRPLFFYAWRAVEVWVYVLEIIGLIGLFWFVILAMLYSYGKMRGGGGRSAWATLILERLAGYSQ